VVFEPIPPGLEELALELTQKPKPLGESSSLRDLPAGAREWERREVSEGIGTNIEVASNEDLGQSPGLPVNDTMGE